MKIKSITKLDPTDYVIYCDTDSLFISAIPIIQYRYPDTDMDDNEIMTKYILEIAKEVQEFINNSYSLYAKKFHFIDKHGWKIKQELIAKSGLLDAKKRYALLIINKEGVTVTPENSAEDLHVYDRNGNFAGELFIKGIDVVRSNFPKEFRQFTKGILGDILTGAIKKEIDTKIFALRDKLFDFPAINIMFPTSANDILDFQVFKTKSEFEEDSENDNYIYDDFTFQKGTPAHIKAALNYNSLLRLYGYNTIEPIGNSDKIKWSYLRQNPYHIDSLALKGTNDPPQIVELVEKYMDRNKNFDSVLKNKLNDFYEDLNWGGIPDSDLIDEFFE
jgi:hypothetical protein